MSNKKLIGTEKNKKKREERQKKRGNVLTDFVYPKLSSYSEKKLRKKDTRDSHKNKGVIS